MSDRQRNSRILLAVIAVFIACLCLSIAVGCLGLTFFFKTFSPQVTFTWPRDLQGGTTPWPIPTPLPSLSTSQASPTPTPTFSPDASPLELLQRMEVPQRDIRLLAQRLKGLDEIPIVVRETPPVYKVGDVATFWAHNLDTNEHFTVTAELRYITPHLYMWVEQGVYVDQEDLEASAERFESETYPRDRAYFGSEWTPGVDGDPHIYVLHATGLGSSIAGYYSSADEYSRLANPYSNEHEMFYIAIDNIYPNTSFYDGVLAHEFQHMIHWANDRNEEAWVNEGCSELAAFLNGYDVGGNEESFLLHPDVQLNTWPELGESTAHYGASYLFLNYFLGRFGDDALRRVIAHPANGIHGFNAILADYGLTFDDVFIDWTIANLLDTPSIGDGRYDYPYLDISPAAPEARHNTYPVQESAVVSPYAADYIALSWQRGTLRLSFQGEPTTRVADIQPHGGDRMWWSNRSDEGDATLTRAFDLRGLARATLEFWTWYDIEEEWDYAYVEVSTDGGESWRLFDSPHMRRDDPSGNAYGPGYTGSSDGWIKETFDLTPFVGHEILLRFEYITDDSVNRVGWFLDDIRIPELGFIDGAEEGWNGWEGQGFVYIDNRIPQRYAVHLITEKPTLTIHRLELDADQSGILEIPMPEGVSVQTGTLVVSALAPFTTEPAPYTYTLELLP